jgi:hypothetical protein
VAQYLGDVHKEVRFFGCPTAADERRIVTDSLGVSDTEPFTEIGFTLSYTEHAVKFLYGTVPKVPEGRLGGAFGTPLGWGFRNFVCREQEAVSGAICSASPRVTVTRFLRALSQSVLS